MNRRLLIPVVFGIAALVAVWIVVGPKQPGTLTGEEVTQKARELKREMKAELAAEGELYEPGAFPNEWSYLQRAYPYDRINLDQLKEAQVQAQVMRLDAIGRSNGIWVERGPDNIGARVSDLEIHPTDPDIVYAGMASGGVFRSTDGGTTWNPIFDDQPVLTIGDVALDPQNPDIIYVGTGEANAHSFSWFGMGVFKSADAGVSWSYAGLEETRYIGRIVVDPFDSDRVWVAATGALYGTNPERGVYRSLDGGVSWDKVLFVSDSTAAIDVAIDPTQPDTVYAAMWERVRGLTYRQAGGWTTGIYRSYDGGDTWTEHTNGLPKGADVGRPGISVCASSPNVIYVIYADHPGYFAGVYKSTDGGDSWTRTNDSYLDGLFYSFGWYFGQIRVDPTDPDRVFAMGVPFARSEDGGDSWSEVGLMTHVDHHAMAFDPVDSARIFEGNDGGIYRSLKSGGGWTKLYDQPTNQFYAIEIDYLAPERLYGGTQDNGTLRTTTGATDDWEMIFGGDGFYCIVDPTDSDIIYAEYQNGYLYKSIDFADDWDWALDGVDDGDRRNWSTPVVMDPSDNSTLYYGTYRVYKTTDGANWWNTISGDLTDGSHGGNFGTITTIAVSPTDGDVIYVGTDDSNVWVTQNGGSGWTDISSSLPNRWVTRVAVDPVDPAIAYATFSGLRWDEQIGYVYRTTDYGTSWTDITSDLPPAPVNSMVVDPDNPSHLFVGTDVGCFCTTNLGGSWEMLGTGLPAVPIYDVKIHQPTHTLVAGTHGRSMHSFDLDQFVGAGVDQIPGEDVVAKLTNHPNPFYPRTSITYALTQGSEISLAVYDLAGRKVKSLASGYRAKGTHESYWDGTNERGNKVATGIYFLRLQAEGRVTTRKLNLVK